MTEQEAVYGIKLALLELQSYSELNSSSAVSAVRDLYIHVGDNPYTSVLLGTKPDECFLVLHYEDKHGWYYKFYDAK
jgi:hypothetical protein